MISQITIKIAQNGQPRDIWFLFETDHATLFDLNETLATDGTVYGSRIDSEPAGAGRRREVGRKECILVRETIVSIIPPDVELLAPEDGA